MSREGSAAESSPYTAEEERALFKALLAEAQAKNLLGDGVGVVPAQMDVKADIEWQGTTRGVRPTTFGAGVGGLSSADMRRVLAAVRVAEDATARERDARPLLSYRAKGARPQWRQLAGTAAGRDALAEAGVTPSRSTLRKWAAGAAPGRDYAARIGAAYEATRTREVRAASTSAAEAVHAVAEAVTEMLAETYDGADIRIRDIERLNFR